MQQGDPLGSFLFALAIHPLLLQIGQDVPNALIKPGNAYADNVIIAGPLSAALQALKAYHTSMAAAGLAINDLESELYVPHWSYLIIQNFASASADISVSPLAQPPTSYAYHMLTGSCVPIVQNCPVNSV